MNESWEYYAKGNKWVTERQILRFYVNEISQNGQIHTKSGTIMSKGCGEREVTNQ
jgi:hypothetical protein